jgi:hypothetical protein
MTRLDLLREAFADTPEPNAASIETGRAALLREVERSLRRRHRRSWSVPLLVAFIATVTAVVFLAVPRERGLTGTEIAAAATSALTPAPAGIWHIVVVTTSLPGSSSRSETWATTSRPYVVRTKTTQRGGPPVEQVATACGSVYSTQGTITLSLRPLSIAGWIEHPTRDYRRALRDTHIRYAGETTVDGVAAYKLVQTIPFHGPRTYQVGGVVTTLIRRGSYYPLKSVGVYTYRINQKGIRHTTVSREVVSYPIFELLPRNATTERLLRIARQPGAFVIPDQRTRASARCTHNVRNLLRQP